MMPSRGIRLVGRQTTRPAQIQCRNLSSTPRPHFGGLPRIANQSNLFKRPTTSSDLRTIFLPIAVSIRHASTSPAAPATSTSASASASETASFPNLDTINLDNLDLDAPGNVANAPESIGYLAQVGIDYGYGPTSVLQWTLEHIHIYSGLPWWASIALTAIAVRAVTIPFYLKSSDSLARTNALVSITKPITERMTAAQRAGDTPEVMAAWQQLRAVRERAGIRLRDQFTPMILQSVIGYCGFKLLRAMSTAPVPGLLDGGFLWLSDLTLTDGYLIVPALMAGSVHLLVRLGGESGNSATLPPGTQKIMFYGLPGLLFLISAWQPGAVLMWFAGSGIVGISQALLLRNPWVRERLSLAPLYNPAPGERAPNLLESMLKDNNQSASSSTSSSSSTTSTDIFEDGKNAAFMRPTYQAPVLRTREVPGLRTIDTKLVKPDEEAVKPDEEAVKPDEEMVPPPKKEGLLAGFRQRFDQVKEAARAKAQAQAQAQARKVDPASEFKRRTDAYEQEARKKQAQRRRQ